MAAGGDVRLALGHLGEASPDVEGHRLPTEFGLPGHRSVERPVDLADPGSVAEVLESPAVPTREPITGQLDQLARRDVEDRGPGRGQVMQPPDPLAGDDPTVE